jgi:hypothetical protein
MGDGMKKLHVVAASAVMASAFVVVGAAPARASCIGEPVNPCAVVCQVGTSNKYTAPLFRICTVW